MAAPLSPSGAGARSQTEPSNAARPPADASSAARQIAELTAELQQREQLIEALTERLEEAAEQLDRIHRTGGSRNAAPQPAAPAIPPELLERHMVTAERLDLALTDWEEKQGLALIERIDRRIDKLVEILRGGDGVDFSEQHADELQNADAEQPKSESKLRSVSAEAAAYAEEPPPLQAAAPVPEIPLADPPEPIAEDEQDPAALMAAVRAREEYISYLIAEMRHQQPHVAINWEAIKDAPEELRDSLEALDRRLRKELQREELDLSLERARIARESAHLEQVRTRLEKEIKKLGLGQEQDNPKTPSPEDTGSWRRLFGKK
jgi:hypothetical protein